MARFINAGSIKTFQKNVTTSGTPVQLTAAPVPDGVSVVVKAKRGNTGVITLGVDSTDSLNTGTAHFALQANQSVSLQVSNSNLIWLDATVSGEGVEVLFEF